jgi:putative flippase GtrA
MRLSKEHEALLGQFVRYGLTGGLTTIVNIGVYWILAARGMDPNLAWAFGYVAAVLVGYVVHSRWSFRGHGRRDNIVRTGGASSSSRW